MILRSDYIDRLIAEYEAEKRKRGRKVTDPTKRRLQTVEKPRSSKPVLALQGIPVPVTRACEHCHQPFVPARDTQRFDFPSCRVAAYRKRKGEEIYARLGL